MSGIVLIVDDSLTIRMNLAEAFAEAGFLALPCANAAQAREILARERIDLIILDINLPDVDEFKLLKELKGNLATYNLPVIMLRAEAEIKGGMHGLQTGADDYIGKLYDTEYVIARSKELICQRVIASSTGRTTVLVIDDSTTFREELRRVLEQTGYSVMTAEAGEEGLRRAAEHCPDAVIVDGIMPGIDGVTVIQKIRLDSALRGTPCLLLTAADDNSAELRALDAGADAFVRKEEDASVVLARLAAILRGARTQRPYAASLSGPKRILAVDNSMAYLQELTGMLRAEGYDVVLARSGEEALKRAATEPLDCILLDLLMPEMDGKETCRRLKASSASRDIPIIMLTALEDRMMMIDSLSSGADDYILKTTEFDVLKARIQAQIRRKQFEDENRRIHEELLQSELKAAEERAARQLAEARSILIEELEIKNKELEAFSYSVSHDLRAPLRSIEGFSQLLIRGYSECLDEKGRSYLQWVHSSAQRMTEQIDDLLLLSHVTLSELQLDLVNLSAIAQSVADELYRREPERNVTFEIEPSLYLTGDNRLMRVILDNLIGNAWKFTSKVESARIEVGAQVREVGDSPVFFVRDNGAGFNMTYAEKLFRPFQRLHKEEDFPGTGIGLATVYRIVERHGGRIWAEGGVDCGAAVYFTIRTLRLEGD